jgi:trehalose-phosphatase
MPTSALPLSSALADRLRGRPFVLFLDVDGTLSPIAPRPEYAIVSEGTRRVLRELVALENTHVAAISGRSAEDARRVVCVDGIWIIGNHGIELAAPGEGVSVRGDVERYAASLARARAACEEIARDREGVIVEDKRWTLSVHYRLAHPGIVPALALAVSAVATEHGLRVTQGKEVLELRPPIEIDKGTAALELAGRLGALAVGASILCAGDDRTDEDAFGALRGAQTGAVTIRVGSGSVTSETAAEFCVNDSDEMRSVLEAVVALRRGGSM